VRVLLGRPPDPTYRHQTAYEDCGRPIYPGDRQQAVKDRHLAVKDRRQLEAAATRGQACDVKLGDLRVLR
jgi:hypothetical protein